MAFDNTRPIFRQIADSLCDKIVAGVYPPGERIPSVRELGASLEVNINTAQRALEYLQNREIVYIRRGIGNFVADDAIERIRQLRRQTFFADEIEYFYRQLASLDVSPDELAGLYADCLKNNPLTSKQ